MPNTEPIPVHEVDHATPLFDQLLAEWGRPPGTLTPEQEEEMKAYAAEMAAHPDPIVKGFEPIMPGPEVKPLSEKGPDGPQEPVKTAQGTQEPEDPDDAAGVPAKLPDDPDEGPVVAGEVVPSEADSIVIASDQKVAEAAVRVAQISQGLAARLAEK